MNPTDVPRFFNEFNDVVSLNDILSFRSAGYKGGPYYMHPFESDKTQILMFNGQNYSSKGIKRLPCKNTFYIVDSDVSFGMNHKPIFDPIYDLMVDDKYIKSNCFIKGNNFRADFDFENIVFGVSNNPLTLGYIYTNPDQLISFKANTSLNDRVKMYDGFSDMILFFNKTGDSKNLENTSNFYIASKYKS